VTSLTLLYVLLTWSVTVAAVAGLVTAISHLLGAGVAQNAAVLLLLLVASSFMRAGYSMTRDLLSGRYRSGSVRS
jgi:hypothetical protein